VTQTIFVKIISSKENKTATFQFFAAWEKSDTRFADQKYFKQYLQDQADNLSSPVKMTIK
jgi:hypothetical protein